MKYQLSYGEIEQLADNIFEITPKKGIIVYKNIIDEGRDFWNNLRDNPFGLLINCKNKFSRSFEGSRDMGKYPLQQKTAFLFGKDDTESTKQLETTLEIKQMSGVFFYHKVFSDRDEAVKWLSDI